MNQTTGLAQHELLELHEIIRSEVTSTKKLQANLAFVLDHDLRVFMENNLQLKKEMLSQYQEFYSQTLEQ